MRTDTAAAAKDEFGPERKATDNDAAAADDTKSESGCGSRQLRRRIWLRKWIEFQ
jgi:hypothetical protein